MSGHVLHLCNLHCDCFPQPPPSLIFSVHISHFITHCPALSPFPPTPPIPICPPAVLCPFWHICCLDTDFECFPLPPLGFWRYSLESPRSVLSKEPKKILQSNIIEFLMHVTHARSENSTQARTNDRINPVPTLQAFDLGIFRAALLLRSSSAPCELFC
jgi:hypothetical protein